MLTEDNIPPVEEKTPAVSPGNFSPVIVDMNGNSLGAILLGILSIGLLIGWMRSETRNHRLITQLEAIYGNRRLDP